jgi:quercetin dioxygenase-like cupin family protein
MAASGVCTDHTPMRTRLAVALTLFTLAVPAAVLAPAAADPAAPAGAVFSGPLPNVPGKTLTAVMVSYPPGGKSPRHRHAGSVFAFVVSGSIRSQNSATGPARVYTAGEGFFEPPGSEHLVSENASVDKPARLLAVFVADDGARLTVFGEEPAR